MYVSNLQSSHLNANFSVVMPFWLGTRYESNILHDIVLNNLFLDLPYTVRTRRSVGYICSAAACF